MNESFIPKTLDRFIIHSDIAQSLANINRDNLINMIFVGPLNTGKKTLMKAFLNHISNTDVEKLSSLNNFELKIGNNKVNIDYISSPYHLEINLYEYGLYDKHILNKFIKEQIKYNCIHNPVCKFIVINHFDYISKDSQVNLKLLLDSIPDNIRFILLAENISNLDSGILSRLLHIRVPKPDNDTLTKYIKYHSDLKYKLSKANQKKIVQYSKRDLFTINNLIECLFYNKKIDLTELSVIDKQISEIAELIIKPNLVSILKIRQICYNLLLINVNMKYVLKQLYSRFISNSKLSDKCKIELTKIAADMQTKMTFVEHDLICIEFFSLKVKKLLLNN